MKTNYKINKSIQYSVLSEDDITQIHYATLDIIENVGNRILNDEALNLLKRAGCKIDGNIVKIPSHLVEKALLTAPKQAIIFNRNGERSLLVEGEEIYFGTGPATPFTLDINTGRRRESILEDIILHTTIAESLPNIDFVMPLGIGADCAKSKADIFEFVETVLHTKKPIPFIASSRRNCEIICQIAGVFTGGMQSLIDKPFIISFPEPISPLTHPNEALEVLLYSAEIGIPVCYYTGATMGSTGPMDIFGSIIQTNAECLTGLVISQLKREGAMFIMGASIPPMNMRNGLIAYGTPEYWIANSAHTKVCQYYGIPTWETGGSTDSKTIDEQAAIESTLCTFMAALSGNNFIHDCGYMDSCLTGSAEMLVMQDEIIGMVRRILEGVDCSGGRELRNLIASVGPGGNYLDCDHTVGNFRKFWTSTLFDKNSYDGWFSEGQLTLRERLNRKTKKLLEEATYQQDRGQLRREINKIVEAVD